jgi:hypothetical protein
MADIATTIRDYLGTEVSWSDAAISDAVAAESAAQAAVCRIPDDYPSDLMEALCRRVAHNLAVRALPLGVQATITDAAALNTYVGGTDAEVRRLEAPYRKLVIG